MSTPAPFTISWLQKNAFSNKPDEKMFFEQTCLEAGLELRRIGMTFDSLKITNGRHKSVSDTDHHITFKIYEGRETGTVHIPNPSKGKADIRDLTFTATTWVQGRKRTGFARRVLRGSNVKK